MKSFQFYNFFKKMCFKYVILNFLIAKGKIIRLYRKNTYAHRLEIHFFNAIYLPKIEINITDKSLKKNFSNIESLAIKSINKT